MNFKDLILIAGIALCIAWGIEYFFIGSQKEACPEAACSGQSFIAQKTANLVKPLITEVQFVDTKRTSPLLTTQVETDHAFYDFSTEGAALERLRFKRQLGDAMGTITTIFPSESHDRENRCFLIALADKAPFFYRFVERIDTEKGTVLVYEAETEDAFIRKAFTVYKKSYQLDLALTVRPKQSQSVEPRIFFPAPIMPDILDRDLRTIIVVMKVVH